MQIGPGRALFADGVAEGRTGGGGELLFERDAAFADGVASRPFLELGAWFFFACFSAGTPTNSAYSGWLAVAGDDHRARQVLATLPGPGERPFVAALPQAALANPRGPLAVLGHVDLAWSWSYEARRLAPSGVRQVSRFERLGEVYRALLQGDRFGVAHHALSAFGTSVGASLVALAEGGGRGASAPASAVFEEAYLWLEYQDLDGYVLLGDPAARLPFVATDEGNAQSVERAAAPAEAPAEGPSRRVLSFEKVVIDCLSRPGDPERLAEMARRLGVATGELRALVEAYRDAGRKALAGKLPG